MSDPIRILVTLNEAYLPHLNVMLSSLRHTNPGERFEIYLLHSSIPDAALSPTRAILGPENALFPIRADAGRLAEAPTTSRYPTEMYYRIFAAKYLPEALERVLYLDPDVVVNGPVRPLYETPMGDCLFAAASHVRELFRRVNELRLDMDERSPYINSGVMLMNLSRLRAEQREDEVFDYIERHSSALLLPDQDVLSGLYGPRILPLDPLRYNMTERLAALRGLEPDWVRQNSVLIHYCGRNKPWKKHYAGRLGFFYQDALARMEAEAENL